MSAPVIRCERSSEFEAIGRVVEAAFDDANVARLVERIRASEFFVPELSLVAERDGAVVGHVMFIPAYYPRLGFERACPLGIEPPRSDIPNAAFMVLRLSNYDASLRGTIVYPPAFDVASATA